MSPSIEHRPGDEHNAADDETLATRGVFGSWGSGVLLVFTGSCFYLYQSSVWILWSRGSALGAWGLALAPVVGVLAPVTLAIRTRRVAVREQLWLYGFSAPQLFGVLLTAIGAVPVCYGAAALNAMLTAPDPTYLEAFESLAPTGAASALAGFLAVVVCVPLGEEVLFRFLLFGLLARHVHAVGAVVATSVLFAAAHLAPFLILPIGLLGIVLGLLTMWSRTLTAAWIGHAVFNSVGYLELCIGGDAESSPVQQFVLQPSVLVGGTMLLVAGLSMLRSNARAAARLEANAAALWHDAQTHDRQHDANDDV